MPKISIVVPVYNREKTLPCCLDSLVRQTFKDLEIIVVDNNSTDGSIAVAKSYVKRHGAVKLIYCKKQGVSAARNAGMAVATGEYLMLVDSDDYLELDACEKMLELARKRKSDLIWADFVGAKSYHYSKSPLKNYLCQPITSCGRLFSLAALRKSGVRFNETLNLGEDLIFATSLVFYMKNITKSSGHFYHCKVTQNSLTHSRAYEYDIFKSLKEAYELFARQGIEEYREELEFVFISNLVLSSSIRYMIPRKDKLFYKQALSLMGSYFPNWRKNKYYRQRGLGIRLYFWAYYSGWILNIPGLSWLTKKRRNP